MTRVKSLHWEKVEYLINVLHINFCADALHLMVIIGGEAMRQPSLDLLIYHLKHFWEGVFAR